MLLTIWNFTGNPIPGYHAAVPDRFSIQNLRKQKTTVEPSKFLVQPFFDFSTTLPKGCFREITLLPHGKQGSNQAELVAQNDQQVDSPGLQIRISLGAPRNWNVVPVAEGSPWRLFLVKVHLLTQFFDAEPLTFVLGFAHASQTYGFPTSRHGIIPIINA
jgi:hypothetical protein